MENLVDKVAVITGGASGVGKALGIALAKEKCRVVLVDIHQGNLDKTVNELTEQNLTVTGLIADVTQAESMEALAATCFDEFGTVHLLFNNAGVGLGEASRPLWELPPKDWEWGFAVNTLGIVNGIRAFVPKMIKSAEPCMVINTSSGNGGLYSLPSTPIYAASKAAATSITEVLHYQLLKAESLVKAAVMFPGPHVVNTGILNSVASRPERFAGQEKSQPKAYSTMQELLENTGLNFELTEPAEVAAYTVAGVKRGDFWILPPDYADQLEKLQQRTTNICERQTPPLPE